MGVHGLWRLIEPSGKPVPLETLENKVLAIDVSIWLHQAIKGFQDSKGAPLPNAHLLGIYHRVCKLLYFKIKPVFVFDGGVPTLKTQTIAKRNQLKSKHLSEADNIQKQLLSTLLKHSAINKVLSESTKAALLKPKPSSSKNVDDLYVLPPSQLDSTISSSEEEEFSSSFTTSDSSPEKHWDIYRIDVKSSQFKSLPPDIRHEILTELKDTRKQNSWGRLHELPTQTDEFSGYQMERLLKRYSVQNAMEEAEKEMGGHSLSLGELEALLNDHGVITDEMGKRLASDENTRFLYIKDVKKALEKAKLEENLKKDKVEEIPEENQVGDNLDGDKEFQRDLEKAIVLSLQSEASTSKQCQGSLMDVGEQILGTKASQAFLAARNYMMEYTGLTSKGIEEIFAGKANKSEEKKGPKIALEDILEETEKILKDNQDCNKNEDVDGSKNENEGCDLPNDQIVEEDQSVKIDNKIESSIENKLSNENIVVKSDSIISIDDTLDLSNDNSNVKSDSILSLKDKIDLSNENSVVKSDSIISINDTLDLSNESVDELSKNVQAKKVTFASPGEVGIMSDSSDSEGFVEVSDSEKEGNKMEIVINPNAKLEDDLFGDIFDEKEGTPVENVSNEDKLKMIGPSKPNLTKLKDLINNDGVEEVSIVEEKAVNGDNVEETSKEVNIVSKEEAKTVSKDISKEEEKDEVKKISNEELKQMGSQLETETRELISERSTKERLAGNITDQMYQEAQELLRLFGVPYIIAPMEAEAQCAFLNEINLTDGTITDDSDIWLFGGKIVYKNFFNQSKHVMEYRSENIEHHFKLSRNQLILLALLVGSDYTLGIRGVGPVTALEILAAFPPGNPQETLSYAQLISGLTEFRNWFTNGKIAAPGRAALRTKLKNLEFTGNFPNLSVLKAYLEPRVETSREKFSWGKPNPVALIDYAKKKFGWTQKKSQEILNPVMQRLQETKAQASIRDYFKTKHKLTPTDLTDKMSKRVKKAISKIGKELSSDEEEKPKKNSRRKTDLSSVGDGGVSKKTRKNAKGKRNVENDAVLKKKLETSNEDVKTNLSSDEDIKVLMGTKKVSKKKIEEEVEKELEVKSVETKRAKFVRESIPQKTRDKCDLMRNKLKAIEVFRKSKQGPGFVKRRERMARKPKDDAELSESSDSE